MSTVSKFVLAAFAALTLTTGVARAESTLHEGGPGVVISQQHVLSASSAHEAQGE